MRFVARRDKAGVVDARVLGDIMEYLEKATLAAPQEVRIQAYKKDVTAEQHRYYRGPILGQISKHLVDCGRPTDSAVLHEMHRRQFLPVIGTFETTIEVDGQTLPFMQTVHQSTADLNTKEMAEFTESVIAYWATEHGVRFPTFDYE